MSAETAPGEHGGVEEPYLTVLPNDTSLEIPDYESSDSDLGSDLDDLQDAEEEEEEEDGLSREQMQDLMRRCQIDDPPPVDDRQAKIIEKKRAAREKNALVENFRQKGSGVYSTYKSSAQIEQTVADKRKIQNLRELKNEYDSACEKADDSRVTLAEEEAKTKSYEQQFAAHKITAQKLFVQQEETEKAWQRLTDLAKYRDSVEVKVHRVVESATAAERQLMKKEYVEALIATRRQVDEVARGERIIRAVWEKDWQRLERKAAQAVEEERKAAAAEFSRKKNNRNFLKPALEREKFLTEQADEVRQEKWDFRTKALLQLKKNLAEIDSKIVADNEFRNKKALKLAHEKKEREILLLEQGLNPYEVFRREEVETKLKRHQVEAAARKQMRTEKLLKQLIKEEADIREKEKVERREKEFQIAYQR